VEAIDPSRIAVVDTLEHLVVAAVALTTKSLSGARGDLDLTLAQWRVLVVLDEAPDGATMSQVAARIGVTLPATTRQLRRLEKRGLVVIGRDQLDRRAARVRLTPAGHAAHVDVVEFRRRQLAIAAERLSLGARSARLLARIAQAIDVQPTAGAQAVS
jgi:DNA-binding MarR family transcriptional regulator